jgi:hypothetical protein
MFVDIDNFNTPPYDLPNLAGNETFLDFVEREEKIILLDLLGASLYNEFILGLEETVIEQRWKDLRDGVLYSNYSKSYKWVGMEVMLTPYIYFKWLEYGDDHASGVGIVVANTENSIVSTPVYKLDRAWREFIRYVGSNWFLENSLYGFLQNSGSIYSNVYPIDEYTNFQAYLFDRFKYPGTRNIFGL